MDILEVSVVTEETLSYHPEYHGVRLDVLAVENSTKRRFNVEMQVKDNKNLEKRSRYYHAQLDMDALLTGVDYTELPDTYVIFICDYNPLGAELYRYTIRNRCQENGEVILDGNYTIWLSTKGKNVLDEPKELVNFLKYVENPEEAEDTDEDGFVKALKEQIAAIKRNRDWEARYMLFEEMMQDEREQGRMDGLASAVLTLLMATGEVSEPLKELIYQQKDEKLLKQWLTIAASVQSPEEFNQKING